MRSIRKLALLAVAALMVCAAVASAASAVTLQNATTHTALAVGDTVTGSSSNWKLTATIFGIPTTVLCSSSTFQLAVTANSPTPTGTVTSLNWTGCKNASATACTVQPAGLPWANAATFNSTTSYSITVPSTGGVTISGAGCLPLSATCTFAAGQTVNFTWSNASSSATVSQTVTSPTCGNGTWSGTYWGSTSGGDPLEVV